MLNKLSVGPLIGLAFLVLSALGIVLPSTVTAPAVTAAVMMGLAAYTAIVRFGHGSFTADAKKWWQSRVIWTQIVACGFASLAIVGIVPAISQTQVVDMALALSSVVGLILAAITKKPIA